MRTAPLKLRGTRLFRQKRHVQWLGTRRSPAKKTNKPEILIHCVGCDIVQADHAPEAGVAQGIFHGILVRHQGRHQEEVEERLEEEVERDGWRENAQATKHKCACMDDME